MNNAPIVASVQVSCTPHPGSPLQADHRIHVHPDGSVSIPDHHREPWAGSNSIEHALGGNFTWTPCDWWLAAAEPGRDPAFWNGPHLHPTPVNTESYLTPETWGMTTVAAWTDAATETAWTALGLLPPHPHSHLTPAAPHDLLTGCQAISTHPATTVGWRGGIPVTALTRTTQIGLSTVMKYLTHGTPWYAVEGFHGLDVRSSTAGRICTVLAAGNSFGIDAFGGPEVFTENALQHGIHADDLAVVLEKFGSEPWMSQDLPLIRDYFADTLPSAYVDSAHLYAVALKARHLREATNLVMFADEARELITTHGPDIATWPMVEQPAH